MTGRSRTSTAAPSAASQAGTKARARRGAKADMAPEAARGTKAGVAPALAVGRKGRSNVRTKASTKDNPETSASPAVVAPPDRQALARGLVNRRKVLGDAWVQRALDNANTVSVEFQRAITAQVWDGIWSRPGIEPSTRRMLVLAITAAMGRWEEFELHVRTGLKAPTDDPASAPLSLDTIKEVLLQTAAYAGVPAGNTGLAIVQKVLAEAGEAPPKADFWAV